VPFRLVKGIQTKHFVLAPGVLGGFLGLTPHHPRGPKVSSHSQAI